MTMFDILACQLQTGNAKVFGYKQFVRGLHIFAFFNCYGYVRLKNVPNKRFCKVKGYLIWYFVVPKIEQSYILM